MPTFLATMRVMHHEIWEVEAPDEATARAKFEAMESDVLIDDGGGDVIDWTIHAINKDR